MSPADVGHEQFYALLMPDETIHHRIPALRAGRGMSRRDLAETVGVHSRTIGYLERGEDSLPLTSRSPAVFDPPRAEVFSDHPFPTLREVLARSTPNEVDDGS
jgi:putative transcriptional regulator